MWKHGFVPRLFEPLAVQVLIPRYRCPTCRTVVTLRPTGFAARYRTAFENIKDALDHRLALGRWPPDVPRQRGGHWLRKFASRVQMDFSHMPENFLSVLRRLAERQIPLFG